MNNIIVLVTLLSGALVVYHHLVYPLLLKKLAKADNTGEPCAPDQLPHISIVVPAYNEEAWIADKIRNLASLDYPADKLTVHIGFDGCSDQSAAIAQQTLNEVLCADLQCHLHEFTENRGKVAVINELIHLAEGQIIALSDTSALLSIDTLTLAAAHFNNDRIGVVNSHYLMLQPGNEGEQKYWQYQNKVKVMEAALGAPQGTHGALYLFRKSLFQPLPGDTINDDFILPMSIVARGYLGVQENRIHAVEMEATNDDQNFKRRVRIGAGNLQQVFRLKHLLNPVQGNLSLMFWSGKALRVACGPLMLIALAGSLYLAANYWLFALLAGLQLLVWGLATVGFIWPASQQNKLIQLVCYLISGHMAIMTGGMRYLLGLEKGRWTRVTGSDKAGKNS
ncbi:glycosyltransferase family 2 protein [Shewanella submarina]|uniref:Glycosyltransferase family 2 protein n=1 Tax=Shewanella submarina TaxID=2016376 RepID=A0ABV7GHU4_9GAMM|nr:glycosyltransferase family 2 protein [Shewanella submarina]MCL1038203.1 glycosyltransferase family 2 protein [Shewanella submarina]